jgi:tryptophan synthase alpha subunit
MGTTAVGAVMSLIGAIWVGNHQRKKKAIFEASSKFKSVLSADLPVYESEETTFSACILELYPKHKAELDQLLVCLPGSEREKIAAAWEPYEQLYRETKKDGASGAVIIDIPHHHLDSSLENVQHIETKQKMQVVKVLNEVLKML